jgi:hypothetical protein
MVAKYWRPTFPYELGQIEHYTFVRRLDTTCLPPTPL